MAALLLGSGAFALFFSDSVGPFTEGRVKNWVKPFVRFLRIVLPLGVALSYLAVSVQFVAIVPVWFSVFVEVVVML